MSVLDAENFRHQQQPRHEKKRSNPNMMMKRPRTAPAPASSPTTMQQRRTTGLRQHQRTLFTTVFKARESTRRFCGTLIVLYLIPISLCVVSGYLFYMQYRLQHRQQQAFGVAVNTPTRPLTLEERQVYREIKRNELRRARALKNQTATTTAPRKSIVGALWDAFASDDNSNNETSKDDEQLVEPVKTSFDYHQVPAVRKNMTLRAPRRVTGSSKSPQELLVLVLSTRNHFQARRVIREAWGASHNVVFLIGGAPLTNSDERPRIQRELRHEQQQHGDLLDTIHPESYQSLPYKMHFAYQWISKHVPAKVEWIVKVDEDTAVRVDSLYRVLLRNLNPTIPMVVGQIVISAPVVRFGKWAERLYPHDHYPYWPRGSAGYAVTRPIVDYLARQTNLTYYQGEDTSLGIWLDEAMALEVSWIHSAYFRHDAKCLEHAWLIMGHRLSAQQMRECHEKQDEWATEERQDKHTSYWYLENLKQRAELLFEGAQAESMYPEQKKMPKPDYVEPVVQGGQDDDGANAAMSQ